jgi:hypothetical protein
MELNLEAKRFPPSVLSTFERLFSNVRSSRSVFIVMSVYGSSIAM